jgi:hypothetical protein
VSKRDEFLADIAAFVEHLVVLDGFPSPRGTLETKIDILQRVLDLLRLKTGMVENSLRTDELLASGLRVSPEPWKSPALEFDLDVASEPLDNSLTGSERQETELQVPLILFMARDYRKTLRISTLLPDFIREIRDGLGARDMERTRTGVTRVVTTTRIAARTLHDCGIFIRSERTDYKRWELSTAGLLVAVLLYRAGHRVELTPRKRLVAANPGGFLAEPVRDALVRMGDPASVTYAMEMLCEPNRDVFPNFDKALRTVAAFWKDVGSSPGVPESRVELRSQARLLLDQVSECIPPETLRQDFSKDFALRELIGGR